MKLTCQFRRILARTFRPVGYRRKILLTSLGFRSTLNFSVGPRLEHARLGPRLEPARVGSFFVK